MKLVQYDLPANPELWRYLLANWDEEIYYDHIFDKKKKPANLKEIGLPRYLEQQVIRLVKSRVKQNKQDWYKP